MSLIFCSNFLCLTIVSIIFLIKQMKETHSPLVRSWSACHGAEEADNEYLLNPTKKPKHFKPQKKGSIHVPIKNSILKFTLSSEVISDRRTGKAKQPRECY